MIYTSRAGITAAAGTRLALSRAGITAAAGTRLALKGFELYSF